MAKRKDLIVFDLDGTLIDSIADYTEATNRLLAEYKIDPVDVATVRYHIGHGLRQFLRDVFQGREFPSVEQAEVERKFFAHYDDVQLQSTRFYEGVEEFLKTAERVLSLDSIHAINRDVRFSTNWS